MTTARLSASLPVVLVGPPDGSAPTFESGTFTVDTGADQIVASNGLSENDTVQFRASAGGTLPAGLVAGRLYYTRDVDGSGFAVSETLAGDVVNITDSGDGTFTWYKVGDETSFLRPLRILQSAGGRELDAIEFEWDIVSSGKRVVNLTTPAGWARQADVRMLDGSGLPTIPLAWGDLTEQTVSLGPTVAQERITVRAEVRPYHFGEPLQGYNVWDPINSVEVPVDRDPVLNPEIDGKIVGNMSDRGFDANGDPIAGSETDGALRNFVDPESMRTVSAQTVQDIGADEWTLREAIRWVCGECNPNETYIRNPTLDDDAFFAVPSVRNVTLRRGGYLPDYLDAICAPHGLAWCLDYGEELGASTRTIRVFRRGGNTLQVEKYLHWPAPGGAVTGSEDTAEFVVRTNVGDVANKVLGYGALIQREVTLELYRGWDESDDAETALDDKPDVWRKWVANEAGDYCYLDDGTTRMRQTTKPIPTTPPDLSDVFGGGPGQFYPRRRRWERPLSLRADGFRYDRLLLEYSTDNGTTWVDVEDPDTPLGTGYRALNEEASIVFSSIPTTLQDAGSSARVRCTGVLTGDRRLYADAAHDPLTTPNAREVVLSLDLSDRFGDRQVETGGDTWTGHNGSGVQTNFGSTLYETAGAADDQDDTTDLQAFVDRVRDDSQSATVEARIALIGLVKTIGIGDLIGGVDDYRYVSFDRNAEGADAPRYLQVTGLQWDVENRVTIPIVTATEAPL